MAFRPVLVNSTKDPNGLDILLTVNFTDGVVTHSPRTPEGFTYRVTHQTIEQVKKLLQQQCDQYDKVAALALPPNGDLDTTPAPPEEPPPPTQAQIDRAAFDLALLRYRAMLNAFKLGLATQPNVDTAKADVVAAYKPAYLTLLAGIVI